MSQRNKYVNSNLNSALSSQKPGSGYSQPYSQTPRYGSGLVSLGGTKKPRLPASSSASKLAVPRPVNLPSLRKENAGNDPNTQIVPSGSGTSWQKVEEAPPPPADPKTALTAGSTWASTQGKESGWQPPAPPISSLPPPRPGARRLNPHEYPSLAAAASGRQQSLPKQRVPAVPDTQGVANWDEDERRLPSVQANLIDAQERAEEVYRPPWDDRGDVSGVHGGPDDGYNGPAVRHSDEDRWGSASTARRPPFFRASPGQDRFGSQDRFGGEFPPHAEDATLFPPPPAARLSQPPPPPPRTEGSADSAITAHVDPEREAFLAQLDSLAQDLEKDRLKKLEAKEGSAPAEEEPIQQLSPPPEPAQSAAEPLTLAQVAAASVGDSDSATPVPAAAQLSAKMARRQRELEEEEAERKRRDAAAAKLRALDEAIAAREAERRALESLAAKAAAEEEAELEAAAARRAAEEAAAREAEAEEAAREASRLDGEAEAQAAAQKSASADTDAPAAAGVAASAPAADTEARGQAPQPQRAAGGDVDVEDSLHGSSVDVQVDSSVAQDAFSDEERSVGPETKASDAPAVLAPPNAWKKPPLSNGAAETWPEQQIALPTAPASKRKAGAGVRESASKVQQQMKEIQAAALPGKDKPVAAAVKESGAPSQAMSSQEEALSQLPPPPLAPKTPALSWRKILAGDEPAQKPEEPAAQIQQQAAPAKPEAGRMRARGRGREGRSRPERDNGITEHIAAGAEGEARGRGRGRARAERQGRGRGERKAAAVAAPAGESASPNSDSAMPAAPDGSVHDQPRRGRRAADGRARGAREGLSARGRGRAAKAPSGRTGAAIVAAIPTPNAAPGEASAPTENAAGSAGVSLEPNTTSADPIVVLKHSTAPSAPALPGNSSGPPINKGILEPPAMPPGLGWDAIAPEPPGLGWGRAAGASSAISGGIAADNAPPASKSVGATALGGPDPPVERPKSAAGVVSRPRSAGHNTLGLPGDLLPNGMPALPADLQLDAPLPAAKQGDAGPKFSAAPASIGGSGFHSGLFTLPNQQSSSMWNQLGQVAGPQPAQQRISGGLAQAQAERQSSEADAGSKAAWGVPAVSSISQAPQANLGAFGSGPSSLSAGPPGLQFGQVMSGGFGAFVPTGKQPDWSANTGKQPDWSTTAMGKQPDWSTGSLGPSMAPASFTAPAGLAAVGASSFTGPQGPGRFSGPMQPNGDLNINGAPSSGMAQGNAAARPADPTANLPDDVFGPDDLRRVEPKASHMRAAGPAFAGHILRGGPDAGGRRGGRTVAAPRGMPAGRGYSRGRGREAPAEMANGGPEGIVRRGREGPHGPGQARVHMPQHSHPLNGPPQQEGPAGFEGQVGGGRGALKAMGRERGRAGRSGGRDRMAQWVPLPNSQPQPS